MKKKKLKAQSNTKKKKKGNSKFTTFILILIFFLGLSVMLYPAISSFWNARTQSQAIIDYDKMIAAMPEEDYTEFFKEAEEYNEKLKTLQFPLIEHEQIGAYEKILDVTGTGMIGYITIDKIGVELPVYHGTEENILSIASGHLKGTSFPIGGEGNHAVVSAHRGFPNAVLFTHLDRMEIGDEFSFTILDREITYRVDQIKTVLPEETQDMVMVEGEDYCTLLTCTPYGINTHRLLVRGTIADNKEVKNIHISSEAYQVDTLIVTPIVALPILIILMMIVLLKPVKKDEDDIGDELEWEDLKK